MNDDRFWRGVERLEQQFFSSGIDEAEFRRKMRRKGFIPQIIDERVEAIRQDYDSLMRRK